MTTVEHNSPTHDCSGTMKALLVGIYYRRGKKGSGQEWSSIPTSIPNVKKFKAFIQERWGYTDITVMTDEDRVKKKLRPTKANLMREIKALCRGVKPGDRRIFYFAGHSDQLPCRSGSEEDGMDEALIALDGFKIKDNTLHNLLVKGLPKGSSLTAIFDSCHSGTMLDLRHYKCNGVYYPWVNKGRRSSKSRCNAIVRRDGRMIRSGALSQPRSRMGSGEGAFRSPSIFGIIQNEMPLSDQDPDKHSGARCVSPEPQFCEGWCRDEMQRKGSLPHADVISISSSQDSQNSWDVKTRNGDIMSMTSSLIKIFESSVPPLRIDASTGQTLSEQRPQITYAELMIRLNHEVHSYTRKMHRAAQEGARALRAKGIEPEDKGETDNFQDIQLGSLTPLDMNRIVVL